MSTLKKLFKSTDARDQLFRNLTSAADKADMQQVHQLIADLGTTYCDDPLLPGMLATVVARTARSSIYYGIDLCLQQLSFTRHQEDGVYDILFPLALRLSQKLDLSKPQHLAHLAKMGVILAEQSREIKHYAQAEYLFYTAIERLTEKQSYTTIANQIARAMKSTSQQMAIHASNRCSIIASMLDDTDADKAAEFARQIMLHNPPYGLTPSLIEQLAPGSRNNAPRAPRKYYQTRVF